MRFCTTTAVMLLTLISGIAYGDFIAPDFRGETLSTYQEWNTFTSPFGGSNLPDVASNNPNGTATVTQLTPGAILTSGGNIYSPGGPSNFVANIPDYNLGTEYVTTAVLQVRALGATIDLDSVWYNGLTPHYSELLAEVGGGQEWLFRWDNISGNGTYGVFGFAASGLHLSLDRFSIDTYASPVPEPTSLALVVLACASVVGRRRRM